MEYFSTLFGVLPGGTAVVSSLGAAVISSVDHRAKAMRLNLAEHFMAYK